MNKYRFPIWFRIYPDENIVSWLEALFSVNGMSKKAFSVTLEGSTELLELENICRKYEGDKFPTLEEIMSRHSEFSTMMPFRNESMNVLVAEQVIRQAEDFHMIPGNKKNHCKVLRCCPECLAEDMANGRRPYIRAWHSLHGVTACAKHGCRLQIYSIYDSNKPVVPADEESLRYHHLAGWCEFSRSSGRTGAEHSGHCWSKRLYTGSAQRNLHSAGCKQRGCLQPDQPAVED